MEMNNSQKGILGETIVALELMKKGLDVININTVYRNYKNADLICMNANNGKSVMIQVKTGTTHNILTGFTSELDGTIPNIEASVIGPWVFVYMPDDTLSNMEFYVLTKEEVIELIKTSNNWYVNEWNRQLTSKTRVGVYDYWLEGKGEDAKTDPKFKKQHKAYSNPLKDTTKGKWEKITDLLW